MCDPVTFSASMAAMSAVTSSIGAFQQAKAQQASLNAQADVAQRNEMLTLRSAGYEDQRRREELSRLTAQQVNVAAAEGGLSGSNLDLIGDSRTEGLLDAAAAEYGAKIKAQSFSMEAKTNRANAKAAGKSAIISALTPLVSFAGTDHATNLGLNPWGETP